MTFTANDRSLCEEPLVLEEYERRKTQKLRRFGETSSAVVQDVPQRASVNGLSELEASASEISGIKIEPPPAPKPKVHKRPTPFFD